MQMAICFHSPKVVIEYLEYTARVIIIEWLENMPSPFFRWTGRGENPFIMLIPLASGIPRDVVCPSSEHLAQIVA